jgi:hypothetical protein
MNYVEIFGWLLLVCVTVISTSPTQARTIKLKYVISNILSYIYIVSICIGYVIKENEIVKNDIKCLFEGKTRRCLIGSTVSPCLQPVNWIDFSITV